jgi:GEVED domain/Secretion system C-terminal sorting domain
MIKSLPTLRSIRKICNANKLNSSTVSKSLFSTIILLLLASYNMIAQVSVTASAGAATGTYTTLKEAIDSVNTGFHQGAISFTVGSGSETTSPSGISIDASGIGLSSYTSLNITVSTAGSYTLNAGTGTATPASAIPDGVLKLIGADNVTIDGLTIADANATNPATMEFGIGLFKASATNGCQNNTIKNCIINLKTINNAVGTAPMLDGSIGLLLINSTPSAATTSLATTSNLGGNSNNTIISNTVSFCNIGIGLSGFAATNIANADVSNSVGGVIGNATGNTVSNFGGTAGATNAAAGIRLLNQWDFNVNNNIVNNNNGASGAANHIVTNRGIYCLTQANASCTINNNTVTMKNGAVTAQISCIENVLSGTAAAPIANSLNMSSNTITNCEVLQGTILAGTFNGIINNGFAPFTINMNGNNFSANSSKATADTTVYIANYTAAGAYSQGEINITNNTIAGMTHNGTAAYTGPSTFIRNHTISLAPNGIKPLLNVSENNITGATFTAFAGSGGNYYIGISGSVPAATYFGKVRLSKNNFSNSTLNHTGFNYFLIASYAGSNVSYNADSNKINNINLTAPTASNFYGFFHSSAGNSPGIPIQLNNNKVSNVNAIAGAGAFYGLYSGQPTALPYPYLNVSKDTIENISFKTTGGVYGVYILNPGDGPGLNGSSIDNNIVTNYRTAGTLSAGVTVSTPGAGQLNAVKIFNNVVSSDTMTGATGTLYGLYLFPGSTIGGFKIYNNNISNLVVTGAGPAVNVVGIYNSSASSPTMIYNNFVSSLIATAVVNTSFSPIIGINSLGSANVFDIHHNTIKLDSSGFAYQRSVGMTGLAWGSNIGSLNKIYNNIVNLSSFGSAANIVAANRRAFVGTANVAPATSLLLDNNNIYYTPSAPAMVNTFLYAEGTTSLNVVNGYNSSNVTNIPAANIKNDPAFNTSCGLYKSFIGLGRETGTFTENNLVAGALPKTFIPTGTSFAESGGVSITTPLVINTDYANASRSATPDMGALEFTGTPLDATPPTITYTPIQNTICTGNPVLSAVITDAGSGLNIAAGFKPRLWFKKFTEANTYPATNDALSNGWKYVEASNTISPFLFTINYNLLNSAVAIGDSIVYFVAAQDLSTPVVNVGISSATFPTGFCPDSVGLGSSAFPLIAARGFSLLPQPVLVTSIANPQFICVSGSTVLSLGGDVITGAEYQWQYFAGSTYQNLPGATASTYTTAPLSINTTFRCVLSCGGVPLNVGSPSQPIVVTVNNPSLLTAPNVTRCGNGTVVLTATVGTGSTPFWYENASGDTAIGSGTSFTYPPTGGLVPGGPYTKYVSAGTACNGFKMGLTPPTYYFGSTTTGYGQVFDVFNPGGITIDSLDIYAGGAVGTTGTVSIQLQNSLGAVINTFGPYTVNNYVAPTNGAALPTATRIGFGGPCAGIKVPAGTGYRLVASAITGTSLLYYYNASAAVNAFPQNVNASGIARITSGFFGSASLNYSCYLYNWKIGARCETSRTPVTITVLTPPSVSISASTPGTICPGSSNILTATSTNAGYSFAWTPGVGLIGSPVTVNPTAAVVYTLTATDVSGGSFNGCAAVSTVSITTYPPAPFVGLSNSNPAVCVGGTSTLSIVDSNALANLPVNTSYCIPTYTFTGQSSDFINNFSLTGPSGVLINNLASGDGQLPNFDFFYYNNSLPPIFPNNLPTLVPGAVYTLVAQAGAAFGQGFQIYLDYNRDGVYGSTEVIATYTSSTASNSSTFTMPATASAGQTRLRVQCKYANTPATTEVCAVNGFGETEDYLVKIGYPNSPATTYVWASSPTVTLTPSTTATVVAAPIPSTTNFTVTVGDANGCTVTRTTIVGVGPIDCGTITSSKIQACAGDCVTLTANPSLGGTPYSYVWKNSVGTIIGLAKTINPCPSVTTTYSLTIFSVCGDSCTTSYTQIVNPLPIVSVVNAAGGDIKICGTNTNSVTINGLGAATYTISPATGVTPATTSTGTFTITTAPSTTYTVIGADAVGCTASTSVLVNYYPNYSLYLTSSPKDICSGASSTICATDTNAGVCAPPTTYIVPAHTLAGPCIDTIILGSFLQASGTSCSLPSYTAPIASAVTSVVIGGNLNIKNSVSPFGYSAVWIDYNQNGNFETTEYTSLLTNSTSNTIVLPIPTTVLPGCTRVRFRSKSGSIAAADANALFIDGETEDFTVQFVVANYTSIASYSWFQAFPIGATTIAPPINTQCVTANNITAPLNVYRVTVTDANGCTKISTVAVNVLPLTCGAITADGSLTVCQNAPRILSANRTGGGSPFTYTWTSSATGTTVLSYAKDFTTTNPITGSVTYTVTMTDACSPTGACSATITLFVNPQPTFTISGITSLCTAGTTNIQCSPGTLNYATPAPVPVGLVPNPSTPGVFTWTTGPSTIFTITGTDALGCKLTKTVNMQFSPPFSIVATANPLGIGPCGGTVTLTAVDSITGPLNLPTVIPAGYCAATHPANSYAIINDVQFGSINNVSGNASSAATITYYPPSPTTTTTVVTGASYFLNMNLASTVGNTIAANGIISIWVDWNRNNLLEVTEWVQPSINTINVTNFPITVPANAAPGLTRMRIRTRGAGNPNGGGDACTLFGSGEGEDYDITVIATSVFPITNYAWTPQPTTPTSGKVVTANPVTSTVYTVVATSSSGCTASSTVSVSVGPVSCGLATATIPSVCSGVIDTLKVNPTLGGTPYTYAWTDATAPTVVLGTTKNIAILPTNTGTTNITQTYCVTVTDNCGLTCSTCVTITVKPLPIIAITNSLGTAAICATGTATLTAAPAFANAVWTPGTWTVGAASINIVNPSTTAIYTLTVTGTNACSNTATSQVTYSPPFTTYPVAAPPFIGCADSVSFSTVDTILTSGPQGPPTLPNYGASASSNIADDEIVGVTIGGTTLNNLSTCATTGGGANIPWGLAASNLNLYSNYSANTPATVVSGQSYPMTILISNCNLTAFSSGQSVWVDWNRDGAWQLLTDTSFRSTITTPGAVSPSSTPINFTFSVPANAAPGLTLMRVKINEFQIGTAMTPTSVSTWGETEDYLINVIGYTQGTSNVYTWAAPSPAPVLTGNPVKYLVPNAGSYTVTSTNSLGCTTFSSVTVNVSPLACSAIVASPAGKDSLCSDGTTTLVAGTTGGGVPSYAWSGPAGTTFGSPNSATTTVSATNNTSATILVPVSVTVTDACGAVCTKNYTVRVFPKPTVLVSASTISICGSGSSILTAAASSAVSTIAAPAGYVWTSNPGTLNTNIGFNPVATPLGIADSTYICTVTDANQCTATSSVIIHFTPTYTIGATATPSTIGVCGGNVILNAIGTVISTGDTVLPTGYGLSNATSDGDEEILGFTMGSLNSVSSCTTTGGLAGNGLPASVLKLYSNFTTVVPPLPVPTFMTNSVNPITLTLGYCLTGTYSNTAHVYIDYNRDGDFLDANELAYIKPYSIGALAGSTYTGSITIPNNATPGKTLLRIVNVESTIVNPIGTYIWGETEDYAINIIAGVPFPIAFVTWQDNQSGASLVNGISGTPLQASPTVATSYTCTATNIYNCAASSTVIVTQSPFTLDSIKNLSNTPAKGRCANICDTVKVKYTGGGAPYTVSFNPNTFVTPINDTLFKVCPTATTTYTVSVSDYCGTSSSSIITVYINPSPIVSAPIDTNICTGGGTVYIGPAVCLSYNTLIWTWPGGTSSNVQFSTSITNTTTFTVTATDFFGCSATATEIAYVSNPHNIKISNNPSIVCYGDTATLSFTDTSLAAGSLIPPTGYCTPVVINNDDFDHITNVTFAGINNSTGTSDCAGCPNGYSGLYSSPIANVICGTTYTLTVKVANGVIGTTDEENAAAWIDWNGDGVWAASEYYGPNSTLIGGVWVGSIAITPPTNAVVGAVRMRVRSQYGALANSFINPTAACSLTGDGEVEDYIVNVSCNNPSNNSSWAWASSPASTVAPNLNPVGTTPLTTNTTYTLTVTDFSGCTYTKTKLVNVNAPITINTNLYNLKCYNLPAGAIKINPVGGTPAYTYFYIDPFGNQFNTAGQDSLYGLPAGQYILGVTDSVGCVKLDTVVLTRPDSFYALIGASSSSCFGGVSDSTYVTAYGGNPPYSYLWLDAFGPILDGNGDPIISDTINNLPAQCYKAFVTDFNGCPLSPVSDPFVNFCITQPSAPLHITATIVDTNLCFKDSLGKVSLLATGGSPGYKYSSDSGVTYQLSPIFDSLKAGTYYFFVKDTSNVCTDDTVIVINQPAQIIQTISITNPTCNGLSGAINFSSVGGTGALTLTANTLSYPLATYPAGTYILKTTDNNGCIVDSTVALTQPDSLISTVTVTNALCFDSNGAIAVTYSGGTNPIIVLIDTAALLTTGYAAGTHYISVTDSNNCAALDTVIITQPTLITNVITITDAICYGGNGSISVISTGGVGVLTDSVLTDTLQPTYLGGASYTLRTTDSNGCVVKDIFTITQPAQIQIFASKTNPTCYGGDGTITVDSVKGGTGPIEAKILNTILTVGVPANFPNGAYIIEAKDSLMCTASKVILVNDPDSIKQVITFANPVCFGGGGSITITSTGGTGSLTDSINGDAAVNVTEFLAGIYTVVTTDSVGCVKVSTVTLVNPPAIIINYTVNEANCYTDSAYIVFTSTGGSGQLADSIDNGTTKYATSGVSEYIASGNYTLTSTDNFGCVSTVSILVRPTPLPISTAFTITNALCSGSLGVITWTNFGGTGIKTVTDSILGTVSSPLGNLTGGARYFTTTDANGCKRYDTIVVDNAPSAIVVTPTVVNPACGTSTTGTISVAVNGGTLPYTTLIDALAPSASYAIGSHQITVADDNGCTDTSIVQVIAAATFGVQTTADITTLCAGKDVILNYFYDSVANPALILNATWSDGTTGVQPQNGSPFTVNATTTFTVTVSDGNCGETSTITIVANQSDFGIAGSAIVTTPSCNVNIATLTGYYDSTTYPGLTISYTWSNSVLDTTPFPLTANGIYTVTGSDGICSQTATVQVNQLPLTVLNVTPTVVNPVCSVDSTGTIAIGVTGGTSPYAILINTLPIATTYPIGAYTVTISDSLGCTDTTIVNIIPAASFGLQAIASATTVCKGGNVLLDYTYNMVAFPNATFTNNWNNGGTGTQPQNGTGFLLDTTTTFTVTISNGTCSESDTITVSVIDLGVSATASVNTTCINTAAMVTGGAIASGVTFAWSPVGTLDATPFTISSTNTYTVTGTQASSGCIQTSTVLVTTSGSGIQLSQAALLNSASLSGNACSGPIMTPDGLTISYADPSCNLIATVADGNGGNVLGNVAACVNVASSIPVYNGQPYVARSYTITPTNQGPADVTLYYTNDDILDYNAFAPSTGFPLINNPNVIPQNGDVITNICINKVNGGVLGGTGTTVTSIPATMTYNATNMRWECTFSVTGFSSFYCAVCNPANVPLSVSILSFTGRKEGSSDILNWATSTEKNNKEFILEHSTTSPNDGFTSIATVATKAVNGNSSDVLNYQSINNKPAIGHNYYRLIQVALDNTRTMSNTVDIVWNLDGAQVKIYPNPAQNELHIDVNINKNTMATIKVLDVTGKLVKQVETELTKGLNSNVIDLGEIATGVYMLKLTDGKGLNYSQQFSKQ